MDVQKTFDNLSIQSKTSFFIFLSASVITLIMLLMNMIPKDKGIMYFFVFAINSLLSAYSINCLHTGNCNTLAYIMNAIHALNVMSILFLLVGVKKMT
jgi:hypothetical protein